MKTVLDRHGGPVWTARGDSCQLFGPTVDGFVAPLTALNRPPAVDGSVKQRAFGAPLRGFGALTARRGRRRRIDAVDGELCLWFDLSGSGRHRMMAWINSPGGDPCHGASVSWSKEKNSCGSRCWKARTGGSCAAVRHQRGDGTWLRRGSAARRSCAITRDGRIAARARRGRRWKRVCLRCAMRIGRGGRASWRPAGA